MTSYSKANIFTDMVTLSNVLNLYMPSIAVILHVINMFA